MSSDTLQIVLAVRDLALIVDGLMSRVERLENPGRSIDKSLLTRDKLIEAMTRFAEVMAPYLGLRPDEIVTNQKNKEKVA